MLSISDFGIHLLDRTCWHSLSWIGTWWHLIFFFRSTNKLVGTWGKERLHAEEAKIKYLQQGFGGIKEIIMSGKLPFFVGRFHKPNKISGLMFKREYIFQYLPKQGVEILAIFGLTGMCLYLLSQEKSSLEIMHMLGIMATAGFRLIPSFSRILTNLQSIRFGWASVEVLSSEINFGKHNTDKTLDVQTYPEQLKFKQNISLVNISFSYDKKNNETILNDINLEIKKGQSIGLIGESGSGKTTLGNLILGFLSPTSGKLTVDGELVGDTNLDCWRKLLGYVPQDVYLMDDTLLRNVAFGFDDHEIDQDRVNVLLKMVSLGKFVEDLPNGLNTMMENEVFESVVGKNKELVLPVPFTMILKFWFLMNQQVH